jgi:hypothetical protein
MKPSIDYGREDIVKFLYLEQLLQQQKVLVIGPENDVVRQIFQRVGCRSVRLFMPGKEAMPEWDLTALRGKRDVTEESRRILPFGAGSFDVIFIPDLAALGDYRMVLSECARIAGDAGLVIISTRNAECTVAISQTGLEETPDIWSLASLEELTRSYFKVVENVGQCPFLAYAVVSFDPGRVSEGVRLDTSLMEDRSEEPEFYLILCCQKTLPLRISNAIYQVPISEMTLTEAPAAGEEASVESPDAAGAKAENELLKKDVAEKNVLVSRLKKEIERLEAEAEDRRQKMFDMKQKMEQDRKSVQKEVLEKAIQKQVDKIPETWMGEREVLMREMEQVKKDFRIVKSENEKLEKELAAMRRESKRPADRRPGEPGKEREPASGELEALRREARSLSEEKRRLKAEVDRMRMKPGKDDGGDGRKAEIESLRKKLEAKERLVRDLLHELELMPQVGYGEDIPAGEEDVLEFIGKMEEMKKNLADSGQNAAGLAARVQELKLTLQESQLRLGGCEKENIHLKERVQELIAINDMLSDMLAGQRKEGAAAGEADVGAAKEVLARLQAVIQFCLDELRRVAEMKREETVGRELALLWARIEEKRRLARLDG